MKAIPPQYIEYLNFEDKRNLLFEINRINNNTKKYSTWCIASYFVLTGIFGWASGLGTIGRLGGDNFIGLFINLLLVSVLLIVSTLMGAYMEFRFIIGAIILQTICLALISKYCPPFCIANGVAIVLYLRILRCMPMYHALAEQEGFPHFLDNQQQCR